jgi:hypothetical protein
MNGSTSLTHMRTRLNNKHALMLFGGTIAGGVVGLLIAEVVVDRVIWGEFEDPGEDEIITLKPETGDAKQKADEAVVAMSSLVREQQKDSVMDRIYEVYGVDWYDETAIVPQTLVEEIFGEKQDYVTEVGIDYYAEDAIYVWAEDGTVIDDPASLFGANAHLHFGEGTDDPDYVHIWNREEMAFYVIRQVHDGYRFAILEETRPEPSKKAKRARRAARAVAEEIYEDDDADYQE